MSFVLWSVVFVTHFCLLLGAILTAIRRALREAVRHYTYILVRFWASTCLMRILSLMWTTACAARAFICLVVDKFCIFCNQFVRRCYFLTYISYVLLCIWRFGSWLYCSVCEWLAVISLTFISIFLYYWQPSVSMLGLLEYNLLC